MAVNYQRFCFPLFLLVLPFTTAFAQSSPSPKSARIEVTEPLTRALRHQLLTLPDDSVFDTIDFSLWRHRHTHRLGFAPNTKNACGSRGKKP